MEKLDIASFLVGSNKSLASQSIGSRVEIYSARWKFMLISDQAKHLVKNCLKAGAVCLLFNRWFTCGILNKSTVYESRKVPCDDLRGESESFTE